MKGHIIFFGAALIFISILVKLSPQGQDSYNDKYMSLLGSPRSPDLRRQIVERHRDLMFFYRTLLGSGNTGPEDEAPRILGAEVDLAFRGMLTCQDLSYLSRIDYIGSGFTKLVLRGTLLNGKGIAVKTVHGEGNDVRSCVQAHGDSVGCHRLATYKLQKEIALMQILRHPGIIQLHGQCYVNSEPADIRVTAMLDLGSPLEMIQLLQAPWEERFKVCLELVRLLHYLANSPLGSVALLDFQPRQFVLVDGSLKLTDLDDATSEEISCREDADCTLTFPARSFGVTCSAGGSCVRANEKRNLYNAYRFFFTYLLPHASPPALRPLLQDIMNNTGDLRFGIHETLRAFEDVLTFYKSGMNLSRTRHLEEYSALRGFRVNETTDDFRCWPSYNHQGCLLSMHSAAEAAEFCIRHSHCWNFVIGQHRTWTGHYLVVFASKEARLIPDENSFVYVRHSSNDEGLAVQNLKQEG
ncbi:PREDICTED: extracellular tyrosine-protein kinase PKDCC-like [Nanorana parkeri]|uniref:extracellular tyrosine-protein kinase PKDCC-like n=1 Tax=Nanorana parkeri TaxID=125878 RepID=UPI0008549D06|nr:PREDICTED: extracellular tyrosine-protein kinase PKDCC-like [Nanorana parkeri]